MNQPCPKPDCMYLANHSGACVLVHRAGWPTRIDMPADPWNEIAPGLWQGGSFATPTRDNFDTVLTLYHGAPPVGDGVSHKFWSIPDGPAPPEDQLAHHVEWVNARWRDGQRVLVRCQAGLNRSGLVVAKVLIDAGAKPDEVIRLIRTHRSPFALCNKNFETFLRSQHV